MDLIQKIKLRQKLLAEELERAKKAAKWGARMKKLAKRKHDPKNEKQFCKENGLYQGRFNLHKNGKITPDAELSEKVEAAFLREGV